MCNAGSLSIVSTFMSRCFQWSIEEPSAEITKILILQYHRTQIDDSHTIDTNNNNLLPLLTGISTPADTLLLGEVIQNEEARLVDGVALSEPTQWEKFADSIVKTHLDKALRRGGGATSAVAAASTSNGSGGKDEDNHVTEQNIEL